MDNLEKEVVLRKDDYEVLMAYLRSLPGRSHIDRKYAHALESELKRARLVDKQHFPPNVVRLNSKVKLQGAGREKIMELELVRPEHADIRQGKISILAPLGTALIGFRQGDAVQWPVPSGLATFTIVEVRNDNDEEERAS